MTITVPNGNICLTFDDSISQQLTQFAARHFSDIADGYLIGPDTIPHITLCQIHHDKPQPRAFRRELGNITAAPEPLRLEAVNHRIDGDYTWLAFTISPTPEWLADLKFEVETVLRHFEIKSLTPFGPDYHPHVALCRFKTSAKANAAPNAFTVEAAQMHLSLGGPDAHGKIQKTFWKKQLA